MRDIVVFERDERYTFSKECELGFRLARAILPAGSSPVAIVKDGSVTAFDGQWFEKREIIEYAKVQAGA